MEFLKKILSYPARIRRSRGFGVHSPFAYNFITAVIRQRDCKYYAYSEIDGFCPRARKAGFNEIFAGRDMSIEEAHLIFRILCYFNPVQCVEMGHGHEVTNIIFKRAVPQAKVDQWTTGRDLNLIPSTGRKLFILVNQISKIEVDQMRIFLTQVVREGDCVVVVRNIKYIPEQKRIWDVIASSKISGIGFTDGHTGIFVADAGLPHLIYNIIF